MTNQRNAYPGNLKYSKSLLILLVLMNWHQMLISQDHSHAVYVIVHGSWGGGWAFKKVDSLLTSHGNTVYRPTLTGLGERNHLSSPDLGLLTHINDIVNVILYENLYDVILVGHSYGGMIITGVADSIPERIKKLVYLDAILPENNESSLSIMENNQLSSLKTANGYIIPWWVQEGQNPPRDVLHPLKTWTDNIVLDNVKREQIPSVYILTVDPGADPGQDRFYKQSERAKKKGWPVLHLSADHNPQWSAPKELVKMLEDIK